MILVNFDEETLLEHLMGDEDIAREVLQLYVDSASDLMKRIRDDLSSSDSDNISLHAHSLKGASSNVGGERMRALAEKAEKCARRDELDSIPEITDQLEAAYADFVSEARDKGWI